jgi:hypothetical protein
MGCGSGTVKLGLLVFPFWMKKEVCYLQNCLIVRDEVQPDIKQQT